MQEPDKFGDVAMWNIPAYIGMKATTLGAVALVAAVMWRIELEIHGWGGLDWIGYFHYAIPAGYVLFLGWVGRYAPIQSRLRRILLLLVLGIAACAWYLVLQYAVYFHFVGGPVFLLLMMHFGEENVILFHRLSVLAIPLTPFAFLLVLYCFGLRPGWRRIAMSLAFYCLSFPIAIQMLDMIPHPGEADSIHAIKSGFVIPFLVVGLGVLVGPPLQTFDIRKMGMQVRGAA